MKAVIRAILLDAEARDGAKLTDPHLRQTARAVPALSSTSAAPSTPKSLRSRFLPVRAVQHRPAAAAATTRRASSTSTLPNYLPPGAVGDAGLVAPEFQILNATTAVSSPNYFYNSINSRDLHRWGTADPTRTVRPNFTRETALAVTDVDALIRRLDLAPHLRRTLSQANSSRSARPLLRVDSSVTGNWQTERVNLAVYLILTSPEFCILR